MTAPVLIFAIGNESRGDDALAPMLVRELDSWLKLNKLSAQAELLEEFQLQIEHAMDMKDRQLVLFIDAGMDTPAPYSFYRTHTGDDPVLYSHAISPESLLTVYEQFYAETPPDAFVLCINGAGFELGDPLTLQAQTHLSSALNMARTLMHEPNASAWDQMAQLSKN